MAHTVLAMRICRHIYEWPGNSARRAVFYFLWEEAVCFHQNLSGLILGRHSSLYITVALCLSWAVSVSLSLSVSLSVSLSLSLSFSLCEWWNGFDEFILITEQGWSLEDELATLTSCFHKKVLLDMYVWTDDRDSCRHIIYVSEVCQVAIIKHWSP